MVPFRRIAIFEPSEILEKPTSTGLGMGDRRRCVEWAGGCVAKGADAFLLRLHGQKPERAEEILFIIRKIADRKQMPLILAMPNIDLNLRCTGFHMKERQALGPPIHKGELLFDKSCHSHEDVAIADAVGFDYVFFSPIFKTASHPYAKPVGLERLSEICRSVKIPVFALGGITEENEEACLKAGAHGIAGIRMWL